MRSTGHRLIMCTVALAALAVAASVVAEEPPTMSDPPAAKAYYSPMVIPAAAFINDGQDPDGFDFRTGGIEGLGNAVEMVAPVYLPDGAKITAFRAYLYDNSNTCGTNREDIDLFLVRTSLVTGTAQTVAIAASEGASGLVQFVPTHTLYTSNATVNNSSYQYWIEMRICSFSHRLNAVVIEF